MTLRTRITLAAVATIVVVAGAVTGASKLVESTISTQYWQATLAGQEVLWGKIIASQLDHMVANTSSLTRNGEALRALQQMDTAQLAERALPVYNRLSASGVLTSLQLTDPHGQVAVAVPQALTGQTSSHLVQQALAAGKITRGIERDDQGTLVVRVAFPLYLRGTPIGTGVFTRTLQAALEDFHHNQHAEAFVLTRHGTVEYATHDAWLSRLSLPLPPLGERLWHVVHRPEHVYAVTVHPLADAMGVPQAHFVSATDFTAPYRQQRQIVLAAYAVGLVGLIGTLTGLSWYMHRALQPLKAAATIMNAIAASRSGLTPRWEDIGGPTLPLTQAMGLLVSRRDDEIGTVVTAFKDMLSQRRQIEEDNVRLLDDAQAANRAKSAFLATMSHELRTPLNAIIGYSEILQEDVTDLGQEALLPDLQKIHRAGRHLLTLISDILDLSKIEAGKMDLCLETFALSHLVEELANTSRPLLETNANTLTVHCAEDVGTMHADLTKVKQVLLNLLSNACKFTAQGTITLEARRTVQAGGEAWLVCTVRDTGIGLTAEQMARLFQPFSQGDNSTTRKYGGTGLGLALSRQLCRLMGGDITVESTAGQGATFTVQFPACIAAPQAEATAPDMAAAHPPDGVAAA